MENMVLTLHIVVCVILIVLVLLQSGKEGMGVIFGGGSSSLFGSTGAGGILVKLTTFVAVIFLATSLGYNMLSSAKTSKEDVLERVTIDGAASPVAPAPSVDAPTTTSPDAVTPVEPQAPAQEAAPSADAPATDATATDAPATQAPATNAPAADATAPAQGGASAAPAGTAN